MKKITLLFLFAIAISSQSFSQGNSGKLEIGLEVGPNRTFLTGNVMVEEEGKSDIRSTVGVSLKYNPSKIFLKTGLYYENKGQKNDGLFTTDNQGNTVTENNTLHINYHYLVLPLLVGASNEMGFFVNIGMYGAYLLKQSNTGVGGPSEDLKRYHKNADVGFTGGLGYARALTATLNVGAELRHNLGLMNTSDVPVADNGSLKMNSTNLLLSLSFLLFK